MSVNGYIVVSDDARFLVDRETARTYRLEANNPNVENSLSQLTTFDGIRGQTSNKNSETLILETIDFVSLRRLLGNWQDQSAQVTFEDYTRVQFNINGNNRQFMYALSPGQNNAWRIYLTDQASVVLGTLNVEQMRAVLEFYDPKTGQTAQRLELSKVTAR